MGSKTEVLQFESRLSQEANLGGVCMFSLYWCRFGLASPDSPKIQKHAVSLPDAGIVSCVHVTCEWFDNGCQFLHSGEMTNSLYNERYKAFCIMNKKMIISIFFLNSVHGFSWTALPLPGMFPFYLALHFKILSSILSPVGKDCIQYDWPDHV